MVFILGDFLVGDKGQTGWLIFLKELHFMSIVIEGKVETNPYTVFDDNSLAWFAGNQQ